MNKQDLISIVIPVYNGESFLRENIECILNQTYTNLEIIYICDMCTDNTVSILQEYASLDSRLIIRDEKERHGADISRNMGKEMANGEWIIFLDSDDLFEENMLETLLEKAVDEGADMCCCFWESFTDRPKKTANLTLDRERGLKLYCETYPVIDVEKTRKYILQLVFHAPWMKLIHKSIYQRNVVYFQDIPNCDDVYFSFVVAIEAKKIVYVNQNLVYYRIAQGKDTISANQEDGIKENYIWEAFDKTYQYISEKENNCELMQSFYHRVCHAIFHRIGYGVYEKLYYRLRDIYFEKWGMWNIDIQKKLSYFYREVYMKIQDGDLDMRKDDLVAQAKRKYVQDMLMKKDCSIWGCGEEGKKLLKLLGNGAEKIKHLFDNNPDKWGEVIAEKIIEKYNGNWTDSIIVTTPKYYEQIKMQIGDKADNVYNLEKEIYLY